MPYPTRKSVARWSVAGLLMAGNAIIGCGEKKPDSAPAVRSNDSRAQMESQPASVANVESATQLRGIELKLPFAPEELGRRSVVLKFEGIDVELTPRLRRRFLSMLRQQPIRSNIHNMAALPLGYFEVGEYSFQWHGNAVIYVENDDEWLWSGPLLQSLIRKILVSQEDVFTKKRLLGVIKELDENTELDKTKMDEPGAYPGGSGAPHHLQP